MAPVAALLLADGRLPNGDYAHSGGVEEAVNQDLVSDLASLGSFLVGLASTVCLQVASAAAAACWCNRSLTPFHALDALGTLNTEVDARMCSAAQRATSYRRGRQLLRLATTAWPTALPGPLVKVLGQSHHGVILGAVAAAADLAPGDAASCAAYGAVAGPAGAAVRLLGLDPLEVAALLVELAPALDAASARAVQYLPSSLGESTWMTRLPAPCAPLLDHLAEAHARREVRLFAS